MGADQTSTIGQEWLPSIGSVSVQPFSKSIIIEETIQIFIQIHFLFIDPYLKILSKNDPWGLK